MYISPNEKCLCSSNSYVLMSEFVLQCVTIGDLESSISHSFSFFLVLVIFLVEEVCLFVIDFIRYENSSLIYVLLC